MTEAKVKTGFIIALYATTTVGCLLVGMNLAGFNESAGMVARQRNWIGNKNIALVNDACVLGLLFGSIAASNILRIGLKNSAILANLIGIIGCFPQLSDNVYALIIGKLVLGFGGGLMIIACSVYIAETLPRKE
jgi:MFS family permease